MNHILLAGASGRLGKEIFAAGQNKSFTVHALARSEMGRVDETLAKLTTSPHDKFIIVDVTLPEGTETLVDSLRASSNQHRLSGYVVGSTGHSPDQLKILRETGARIPVILSSNFSRGVYLFEEILNARTSTGSSVAELARTLGFDLSLWESHHTLKKDAPSGTARTLANAAGIPPDRIASTRVGAVVGEHALFMSQESEELRITHTAHARRLFAEGALDLCCRMFESPLPAGMYNMAEALRILLKG
jgi:4-hydroxy-tetrahydrodipicolinate reductase